MLNLPRWQTIAVVVFTALGALFALPNILPATVLDHLPGWYQQSRINLGLDLRGGAHFQLEVDLRTVLNERLTNLSDSVRAEMRKQQVGIKDVTVEASRAVIVTLRDEAQRAKALEAIRAGADPVALARHYVVDLLAQLAAVQDSAGQGLSPEQQALVRHLATLHEEGCTDPATFRALRRTATAATDAAAGDLEGAVLRFAESVAWPLAGLVRELAEFAMRVHMELRSHLALERPSPAEQATLEAVSVMYGATTERLQADPKLDFKAEFAKIEATPEFAAANDAAFQAQLEHYDLVAAEAYAPFAVELLLGAFRKA